MERDVLVRVDVYLMTRLGFKLSMHQVYHETASHQWHCCGLSKASEKHEPIQKLYCILSKAIRSIQNTFEESVKWYLASARRNQHYLFLFFKCIGR